MNPRFLMVGLLAVVAAFVGLSAFVRSRQERLPVKSSPAFASSAETRPAPRPAEIIEKPAPRPPEDPKKQGVALHDATLSNLIENARMAQERGDLTTRDAMVAGLKKSPERSIELISKRISTTSDRSAAAALQTLIERLK